MHYHAMVEALFLNFVAANVAGHQAEHAYSTRFGQSPPDAALFGFTFAVGLLCFFALLRLAI